MDGAERTAAGPPAPSGDAVLEPGASARALKEERREKTQLWVRIRELTRERDQLEVKLETAREAQEALGDWARRVDDGLARLVARHDGAGEERRRERSALERELGRSEERARQLESELARLRGHGPTATAQLAFRYLRHVAAHVLDDLTFGRARRGRAAIAARNHLGWRIAAAALDWSIVVALALPPIAGWPAPWWLLPYLVAVRLLVGACVFRFELDRS